MPPLHTAYVLQCDRGRLMCEHAAPVTCLMHSSLLVTDSCAGQMNDMRVIVSAACI